jgi:hypothetical protein
MKKLTEGQQRAMGWGDLALSLNKYMQSPTRLSPEPNQTDTSRIQGFQLAAHPGGVVY